MNKSFENKQISFEDLVAEAASANINENFLKRFPDTIQFIFPFVSKQLMIITLKR